MICFHSTFHRPKNLKSDQYLISPNRNTVEAFLNTMRIKEMTDRKSVV